MGRSSMSGMVSFGTAIRFPSGDSKCVMISNAPEARNIETATIRPMSDGAMETVVSSPSFAPARKLSKMGTFFKNPNRMINPMIHGIM